MKTGTKNIPQTGELIELVVIQHTESSWSLLSTYQKPYTDAIFEDRNGAKLKRKPVLQETR